MNYSTKIKFKLLLSQLVDNLIEIDSNINTLTLTINKLTLTLVQCAFNVYIVPKKKSEWGICIKHKFQGMSSVIYLTLFFGYNLPYFFKIVTLGGVESFHLAIDLDNGHYNPQGHRIRKWEFRDHVQFPKTGQIHQNKRHNIMWPATLSWTFLPV